VLAVVTRRSFRGHQPAPGRLPGAGRHADNRASPSGEPHTASTADNRRRSADANTAQPANKRASAACAVQEMPSSSRGPDQRNRARHPREAEQIRKPGRTAARGAPRLGASRYEKLAVRYLGTVGIAAINEWLPRAAVLALAPAAVSIASALAASSRCCGGVVAPARHLFRGCARTVGIRWIRDDRGG